MENNKIKIFESKKVRTVWNADKEEWYFSVVDVVSVLINSDYDSARKYWKVLKGRLKKEGSELVTNCYQLRMLASDGKNRLTDVLDTKGILRLVQSIPSQSRTLNYGWQCGKRRLDEIADRKSHLVCRFYRAKGYMKAGSSALQTIEMPRSYG